MMDRPSEGFDVDKFDKDLFLSEAAFAIAELESNGLKYELIGLERNERGHDEIVIKVEMSYRGYDFERPIITRVSDKLMDLDIVSSSSVLYQPKENCYYIHLKTV